MFWRLPRSFSTAWKLSVVGFSLLMLGGMCSPDPQPCQTVALAVAPTTLGGTLNTDGGDFDLATMCSVSLAYSDVINDATPIAHRFIQSGTQFVIKCGKQPEYRVSTGAIFPGAPFEQPREEVRVFVETINEDNTFCRMTNDATLKVSFATKAGQTWPDGNTPVSDDFERTFSLELEVTPPHMALQGQSSDPLCQAAESINLFLSASFTIRAKDIEHEAGLTCVDGSPR